MADENNDSQNKNTEDIKKISQTQDFEMGDEEQEVKINHYTNDIKEIKPMNNQPSVNPEAQAPEKPVTPPPQSTTNTQPTQNPPAMGQPPQRQGQTIGQAKAGLSGAVRPLPNPAARKKALLGCLGGIGSLLLIFLVLSFIFLAQTGNGDSPIARMLGVNEASFVNSLITLIHIVFIFASLIAFVFTMVGLFKASMAKREDKEGKKSALKSSLIAGLLLFLILIIWVFVYAYLDGKRQQIAPQIENPIITDPEEVINLQAPIEIEFRAGDIPINKNQYKIIFYEWDFGDGETGTDKVITHVYEKKGIFDVVLKVTLEDKNTGESVPAEYGMKVSVTDQALTATFTATPQSGEAPLEVALDASESVDPDGKIETYEWDLDADGEYDDADGVKVEHTFDKIGIYVVALRVTSTIGDFEVSEKEIVVEEKQEAEAKITIVDKPTTFTQGVNYTFKGDESSSPKGDISKYEWDFGDGTALVTTKTAPHVFNSSGTYEVKLKVTDSKDNIGETTMVIKVESPQGTPKAKITTDPLAASGTMWIEGKAPFTVLFDASETTDSDNNIVDYEWDFNGDGAADAYGENGSYTYQEEGTYNAKLIVTDANNNTGTATQAIKVLSKGVKAVLSSNKVEGNIPLTIEFDASGSTYDKGQITSYEWDFGDGTTPKLGNAQITHKYTVIGSFVAKVTVTGSDNAKGTATMNITVREIPLEACFVSVFEKGTAPLETTFDPGCSSGSISTYFWDFGDGGTSTSVKPKHTFTDPGTYTATLEVSDSQNNISKAEVTIEVTEN